MVGYFKLDAETFADWGVDFIKIDGCYADVELMVNGKRATPAWAKCSTFTLQLHLTVLITFPPKPTDYIKFGEYMNRTGRPILYSCSWPAYQEYDGIIVSEAIDFKMMPPVLTGAINCSVFWTLSPL